MELSIALQLHTVEQRGPESLGSLFRLPQSDLERLTQS